jgi:hypothetical protein
LAQERPHHLTKTASACALCFASNNQFFSNLWFSVQSSSTWSNSSTAKASTLPDGAYSWVAALVMVMKQSENRAGNKMELTWIRPLHGSAVIIAKTVVKTVDGLSKMMPWG